MSHPSASGSNRLSFLTSVSYAHRGLHKAGGPPENSRPAFLAACAAGYGIECDIRLSSDKVPFVFHDALLDRLTGISGPLSARTAAELDTIMLQGDGGPIPRLSALFDYVDAAVPLLIELKTDRYRDVRPICEALQQALSHYNGPVAVMGFHPAVVRWFRKHAPQQVCGLVVSEENRHSPLARLIRRLAFHATNPDFLAYDIRSLPNPFVRRLRSKDIPVLSWTVRTAQQWKTVEAEADAAIFEHVEAEAKG